MLERARVLFNNKIWNNVTNILFPVILVFFALMHIGEGLTVTDTGYNYGNFVFMQSLDDMWKFSTYLANVVGAFFTQLPFGKTMIGLNFYTGLLKVVTALLGYIFCIKGCKIRREIAFLGEVLALGLCWCPTALIYNYLTYLLFGLGAMFLYVALVYEKNIFFVLAGLALGLNVFVRLPNVAEVALIVVVWFCGIYYKGQFSKIVKQTLFCVMGYIFGIGTVFVYILCRYGLKRYVDGITALFAMTDEAGSYTVKAMLLDMVKIYIQYFKWFFGAVCLVVVGMLLFKVFGKKFMTLKAVFYGAVTLVLVYLYYRKDMFDFNYRGYISMFAWGVMCLTFCLVFFSFRILFTKRKKEEIVMETILCVIIIITPLGSNNHLYTPINNLFLIAPYLLHCVWDLLSDKKSSIMIGKLELSRLPYKITVAVFACCLLFQSILFGMNFVFRDGLSGEARTFRVEGNAVLEGMCTTKENAKNLQELQQFFSENGLLGSRAILFGNVPALAFYYELMPALSSTWPDLPSYSYAKFETEICQLSKHGSTPLVVISANPADVGNEEKAEESLKKKWACLNTYMEENSYKEVFSNDAFKVYSTQ